MMLAGMGMTRVGKEKANDEGMSHPATNR